MSREVTGGSLHPPAPIRVKAMHCSTAGLRVLSFGDEIDYVMVGHQIFPLDLTPEFVSEYFWRVIDVTNFKNIVCSAALEFTYRFSRCLLV